MSNFIINGERIVTKPEGQDYDLMPGKVYDFTIR